MSEFISRKSPISTANIVEEPAMVMGFLPTDLHAKLRQMATETGCSENALVSQFVREALTKRGRKRRSN